MEEVIVWIPKEKLQVGMTYRCKARNFEYGIWNGKSFEYTRFKFGYHFQDTDYHWEDGGTVKPVQRTPARENPNAKPKGPKN